MKLDQNPNISMKVLDFILLGRDKNVNEMYQRSFAITPNEKVLNTVEDMLYNNGFTTQTEIVKKCNTFIHLDPTTGGLISVPNGWNNKKLSFVLSVEVTRSSTVKDIYFINGFTDFYDPILNTGRDVSVKYLDPSMDFNINTITLVTETLDSQGIPSIKFKDKITILRKHGQAYDYDSLGDESLIRPNDIFSSIYMGKADSNYGIDPTETNRSQANTISFLSDMLNNIADSINVNKNGNGDERKNRANALHDMIINTEESKMMNCPFLVALFRRTGEAKPSRFNIDDLLAIAPYLDDVTKTVNIQEKEEHKKSILSSDVLDKNINPTIGNLLCMEFYQIMSSILFDNMITRVSIHISNHRKFTYQDIASTLSSESIFHKVFNTPRTINIIDSFLRKIILPKMTMNGEIDVDLIADINILDSSSIAITVNDDDPEVYRYKSSMDNLYSPYIATNNQKNVMVDDVSTLMDTIIN